MEGSVCGDQGKKSAAVGGGRKASGDREGALVACINPGTGHRKATQGQAALSARLIATFRIVHAPCQSARLMLAEQSD
mgnify:CR=1 FL=1